MNKTPEKCLINLSKLSSKNRCQEEYSSNGVTELTGSVKTVMQLPFTRESFVREQPIKQQGLSISGFQPKLSLIINSDRQFEVTGTLGQYILKPSPERFPHLAENEHASMMVMKKLGFEVPPFGLTRFQPDKFGEQELAFIIKRFDRTTEGKRVHQEQLDSAMTVNEKYGRTRGDGSQQISYEQIGRFLTENLNSSLALKRDYYQRVIVSYLIGNNDQHLRNFAVLYPLNGTPCLAPVYDYVSVAPYPEYSAELLALPLLVKQENDEELADGFNTKYGQYIGHDFIEFGTGIGLSQKAAMKYLADIVKQVPAIQRIYEQSLVEGEYLEKILSCIRQRAKCLAEISYKPL